jgi:hypothetical protein
LQADYLIPDLGSVRAFLAVRLGRHMMAVGTELLPNRPERRQESLGMAWRLKPPHRPLALPRWLMEILSAIVEPPMLAMFDAPQHLPFSSPIARQFIRDDHTGHILAAFQQLPKDFFDCRFVPAALDEDVQHVPFVITSPPELVDLSIDLQEHLIEVPLVA